MRLRVEDVMFGMGFQDEIWIMEEGRRLEVYEYLLK